MTTDAPLAELTLVEAAMRWVWTRGPSTFLRAVASSRPLSSRDPPPPERVLTTRPTLLRARRVLNTPNPSDKAALTDEIAALWASGTIAEAYRPDEVHPDPPAKPARCDPIPSPRTPRRVSPRIPRATPEVPTLTLPPPRRRDDRVTLVEPSKAPRLGKGGSPESRIAILHSLAHLESWAIDLSWDIVARFGAARRMPRAFFDDSAPSPSTRRATSPPLRASGGVGSTARSTPTTVCGTARRRRRTASRCAWSSNTARTRREDSTSSLHRRQVSTEATTNRGSTRASLSRGGDALRRRCAMVHVPARTTRPRRCGWGRYSRRGRVERKLLRRESPIRRCGDIFGGAQTAVQRRGGAGEGRDRAAK